MKIATAAAADTSNSELLQVFDNLVEQLGNYPDLLLISCSVDFDLTTLLPVLSSRAPAMQISGGTSCRGVMTDRGVHMGSSGGLAMLGIYDPEGRYGVGGAELAENPAGAAREALVKALAEADCPGEVPTLIWMTSAPGNEETLIEALSDTVGCNVPIIGGSAADNTLTGEWKSFANREILQNSVVITVLFPSTELFFTFHSGYQPTEKKGTITKARERQVFKDGAFSTIPHRIIQEIDHKPAAEVYNEWTGGIIAEQLDTGGSILPLSTLSPLGSVVDYVGEVPFYKLSHPESVTRKGALTLFTTVREGEEITLMHGTVDSLVTRAGRVITSALTTNNVKAEEIAGAMVVYCAGCMLTVEERLAEVADNICEALPSVPFLGSFTYGEQGSFLSGSNQHGNLMISVLLFTHSTLT